jgi:hypothetical protein
MSNNNYLNQIEKLSEQLEQLQIDFAAKSNRIKRNINRLKREIEENIEENSDNDTFELGNYVEIVNNYQGLRGRRGFVIKITDKQVTIRDETNQRIHIRGKNNVKKVERTRQSR